MIVEIEKNLVMDIPEDTELLEWSRAYFFTSAMDELADYYGRLEYRYARMGMGLLSLDYRRLREETLSNDEKASSIMAYKLAGSMQLQHRRLYRRYRSMGLYQRADHHHRHGELLERKYSLS